jgi:hypothetical protein
MKTKKKKKQTAKKKKEADLVSSFVSGKSLIYFLFNTMTLVTN